jgi:hypothetical protein
LRRCRPIVSWPTIFHWLTDAEIAQLVEVLTRAGLFTSYDAPL